MKKKNIVRVSDELMELIENPKLYDPAKHTHCLWCGMMKVERNRPCEVCGLVGNSKAPVRIGFVLITYGHDKAPATKKVKPGLRRAVKRSRSASDRTLHRSSAR